MRTSLVIAAALVAAVFSAPRALHAEINKCHASDGTLVFTDQSCDLLGRSYKLSAAYQPGTDVKRPGRSHAARPVPRYGIGCAARSPEGMRLAVRTAIDSGDANQLSALIDWNGTKRRPAMETMRRLQHIVSRPAVSIEIGDYGFGMMRSVSSSQQSFGDGRTYASVGAIDSTGDMQRTRSETSLPGLHILRAHGESSAMSHTRFALVRDAGCLWLRP